MKTVRDLILALQQLPPDAIPVVSAQGESGYKPVEDVRLLPDRDRWLVDDMPDGLESVPVVAIDAKIED